MRRALDAMHADPARDWSLADLARTASSSNRTLQRQFQVFLGQTPLAKLRGIRFDRARGELLRATAGAKVMDIALRCGFPHFGRFSTEYRRRYGETPSQTIRRQATVVGALASIRVLPATGRDRPTVALTTFETGVGDSEAARAIADELAIALVRAGISVTSQSRDARYRLAGALRRSGNQARLTLRFIEADTGRYLWADRNDGAGDGDFVLDEYHATRIVAALQPHLRQAEIERARRRPDSDLSTHDLALRALPHVLAMDAEGNARALDLLARALERDPEHALATSLAAWAHAQRVVYHFSPTPLAERARGMELVRRALALGGDAATLALLANALTSLNDVESADLVVRKALAADGGSAWAWSRGGWVDVYKGDSESAIERFRIALELAPQDPLAFNNLLGIGVAHFNAGRYPEAARWQELALREHPSAAWIHRTMCPAYVLAGADLEARRSLAALRENYPDLTVASVEQGLPPLRPAIRELVFAGLSSAGLPP